MASYRLYCVGGDGKIESAEWLEASCDEDAIMAARELNRTSTCELWDHGRLVARLPREGPSAFFVPAAPAHASSTTPSLMRRVANKGAVLDQLNDERDHLIQISLLDDTAASDGEKLTIRKRKLDALQKPNFQAPSGTRSCR